MLYLVVHGIGTLPGLSHKKWHLMWYDFKWYKLLNLKFNSKLKDQWVSPKEIDNWYFCGFNIEQVQNIKTHP